MSYTESDLQKMLQNPAVRIAGLGKIALPLPTPLPIKENASQSKFGGCGKQTKTEMEYGRMLGYEFPDCTVEPFAITLRLAAGHKYSPDYVVKDKTGIRLIVEVKQRGKDGFRQNSYQRAKVMFDQSRIEYPFWKFRWSEKHCGIWDEKTFSEAPLS